MYNKYTQLWRLARAISSSACHPGGQRLVPVALVVQRSSAFRNGKNAIRSTIASTDPTKLIAVYIRLHLTLLTYLQSSSFFFYLLLFYILLTHALKKKTHQKKPLKNSIKRRWLFSFIHLTFAACSTINYPTTDR